jgi:hypothetical protein
LSKIKKIKKYLTLNQGYGILPMLPLRPERGEEIEGPIRVAIKTQNYNSVESKGMGKGGI